MDPAPDAHGVDVARLFLLANEVGAASSRFATGEDLEPFRRYLEAVRQSTGMDVAFVSRFVGDRRRFELVATADPDSAITAGGSDAIIDTYCKLVAEGTLPAVVRDVQEDAATALPIATRLGIRSYLSARIVLPGERVFGTVCCFSHEPREDLRAEHAAALQAIADAIAQVVMVSGMGGLPPARSGPGGR